MEIDQPRPAYFAKIAENTFKANAPARGPWSPEHCHAGPVTGLIVRAFEEVIPDKMLTRVTLDLLKPVPMDEIRVLAIVRREGRTVSTAAAEVIDQEGRLCVSAQSMHVVRKPMEDLKSAPVPRLVRSEAQRGASPLARGKHGLPSFTDFIQVAYPEGENNGLGPKTIWMKTPPLLPSEQPSPFQSICALADCGNGLSRNAEFEEMIFLNTDLTIHFHREPRSDWLASRSLSHWQSTGIGLAQAVISDDLGPVATALQTLILRPQA
ncbi:MAG: thioesterase family protein [Methyloligellaceae bacterium]